MRFDHHRTREIKAYYVSPEQQLHTVVMANFRQACCSPLKNGSLLLLYLISKMWLGVIDKIPDSLYKRIFSKYTFVYFPLFRRQRTEHQQFYEKLFSRLLEIIPQKAIGYIRNHLYVSNNIDVFVPPKKVILNTKSQCISWSLKYPGYEIILRRSPRIFPKFDPALFLQRRRPLGTATIFLKNASSPVLEEVNYVDKLRHGLSDLSRVYRDIYLVPHPRHQPNDLVGLDFPRNVTLVDNGDIDTLDMIFLRTDDVYCLPSGVVFYLHFPSSHRHLESWNPNPQPSHRTRKPCFSRGHPAPPALFNRQSF